MTKKTTLKKFTDVGHEKFTELISQTHKKPITEDFHHEIAKYTTEDVQKITPDIEIELLNDWESDPPTQYEFAKYLFNKADHVFETENLENDKNFWAYLSAFYITILAPINTELSDGNHYYLEESRYKYRMRIRSWYLYYSIHKGNSKSALNSRQTNVLGDLCEQVFSRVHIRNSKLFAKAYQKIDMNTDNGKASKDGDLEKHRNSLRYVVNEISQYNTTIDIHSQDFDWVYENLFVKNKSSKHFNRKSV